MQNFNLKTLNHLGMRATMHECIEFAFGLVLLKSKIFNKKVAEIFDKNDMEIMLLTLGIWANEGMENSAYDFIELQDKDYTDEEIDEIISSCEEKASMVAKSLNIDQIDQEEGLSIDAIFHAIEPF